MNTGRETLGAFCGLVVTLTVLGWYWGAHKQAVERSCIELKAAERTFNGGIVDSIARGWDWPIHWMKGTQASLIPCGGTTTINAPEGSIVGDVLRRKDMSVGPNILNPPKLEDMTKSPIGHRNLDRFLVEHSGNQPGTPNPSATTDQAVK